MDLTINTQPAIFLISYSIFKLAKEEFNKDLSKAKFFAGHSLGEYSAIACAGYLDFIDTIRILKIRGNAMQNSVPKGEGGMIAILGTTVEIIEKILQENKNNFFAEIANDNSVGQIVLSGKIKDLDKLSLFLKDNKIKNVKLPVSAPFHCSLMSKATEIMREELGKLTFKKGSNPLISNVTADEIFNSDELKDLLVKQIENRVRWKESVINMIEKGVDQFIEIGPGKVLTGMVKRTIKGVNCFSINSIADMKNLNDKF